MDLKCFIIDGEDDVEELSLCPERGQAVQEGGTVAWGRESAFQGAALIRHARMRDRERWEGVSHKVLLFCARNPDDDGSDFSPERRK